MAASRKQRAMAAERKRAKLQKEHDDLAEVVYLRLRSEGYGETNARREAERAASFYFPVPAVK